MPSLPQPSSSTAQGDVTVVKIVELLRDRIIGGRLVPGHRINSVELAHDFGTSRTPVREALLILSQHGLVSLSARRRPHVASVTAKTIQDLYAVRSALHDYVAEAIVQRASDAELAGLRGEAEALLHDFDQLSTEAHLQAVERYLANEAQLAGNALVLDMLESLRWRIAWFRRLGGLTRELLRTSAQDRLRVAQAYCERDVRLAQALNRSMLRRAGQACEDGFRRLTSRGR